MGLQAWDAASFRVETSLTGRLWYEFDGDNAVTVFNPGSPFVSADTFDGAFGEIGASVNVFGKQNGWNGFTTASVKFGDGFTSESALAGIRHQW